MANEITQTSYGESSKEDRERSGYRIGESFSRPDAGTRYSFGSSIGEGESLREEQQRSGYYLPDEHYQAPAPFDLSTTKPNGTHSEARVDEPRKSRKSSARGV